MKASLVEWLARREPKDPTGLEALGCALRHLNSNPAYGWHSARAFARAREHFPAIVTGRDHWLFLAYMMMLHPVMYADPDVQAAFDLSQQGQGAILKALLMAGLGSPATEHLDLVAAKSGIPRRTVEAFETLFFNILDRPQDGLYLSEIVYPRGRIVEFDEDYFETAPIADLVLRAAYNYRDIDLVARLAGMDSESCAAELSKLEAELQNRIVGNALVMAKSGLLNESHGAGLDCAAALVAARKSSRRDAAKRGDQDIKDISAELSAAFSKVDAGSRDALQLLYPPRNRAD
jgi:hypothetical protein